MDRLGTDWGAEAGCVDGTEEEGRLRGESGLDMDCCTPDIDEMRQYYRMLDVKSRPFNALCRILISNQLTSFPSCRLLC